MLSTVPQNFLFRLRIRSRRDLSAEGCSPGSKRGRLIDQDREERRIRSCMRLGVFFVFPLFSLPRFCEYDHALCHSTLRLSLLRQPHCTSLIQHASHDYLWTHLRSRIHRYLELRTLFFVSGLFPSILISSTLLFIRLQTRIPPDLLAGRGLCVFLTEPPLLSTCLSVCLALDEILVNAADVKAREGEEQRDKPLKPGARRMSAIKIDINSQTGRISIWNDGEGEKRTFLVLIDLSVHR